MIFTSCSQSQIKSSLADVLFTPFAPDGTAWMPEYNLDLRPFFYSMDSTFSYNDIVTILTTELFKGDLSLSSAEEIADRASRFSPEIRHIDDTTDLLELYTGPNGTFKDFGLAFLASLYETLGAQKEIPLTVVIASQSLSGAATAHAFSDIPWIRTVIVSPKGCTLPVHESLLNKQNIVFVEMDLAYKTIHKMVQRTLKDSVFVQKNGLVTPTSLNPARLISQIFYYAWAFTMKKKETSGSFSFAVPSGHYGNLIAGLLSWRMGLPVHSFIQAMDERCSQDGKDASLLDTIALTSPENYERALFLAREAPGLMTLLAKPEFVSGFEILDSIESMQKNAHLTLDPRSAAALVAAKKHEKKTQEGGARTIILATEHPLYSPLNTDAVLKANINHSGAYKNTKQFLSIHTEEELREILRQK